MKTKTLYWFLIFAYAVVFLTESTVQAYPVPIVTASISAQSAILLDPRTNRVLYSKRPHRERPAASTTKVMTALVVIQKLPLDRVVRVPKSAEYIPPSKVFLRMGERYTVRDLLKALLINSANDAAHTLAVACSGTEARFAQLMNVKARSIGARQTRFVNASGLPNPTGQYTTAYDLALIMKAVNKNSFIKSTMAQKYCTIKALTGRRINLRNHNKMLWRQPHNIQGKTGFTRKALHCFVGNISAPRRGDLLVAIMGSLSPWHDLTVLLGISKSLAPFQMQFNKINLSKKEVAEIQRALWHAGFHAGRVDGIFGSQTLKATKAFQKSRGLDPDGIVGSMTWSKLEPYLNR